MVPRRERQQYDAVANHILVDDLFAGGLSTKRNHQLKYINMTQYFTEKSF
jgi:hypothetical protein